jgi:glycosyltransferase involved in cell wall biosynthesis
LLCLTTGVQEALAADFGPAAPALVLPSGTDVPEEEPPGDAERDIDILYVGKLAERKGVYDLVRAMRFLPAYRLCLVGGSDADVRAVMQLAEQIGVGRQLQVTGYLAPAEVGTYYRRARVGVCPLPGGVSRIAEVFTSPLKLLDMMAHGTPIVATDLPSVRELVADGQTAILARPSSPEALAVAIQDLLEDRRKAQQLAHAARAAVWQYTWSRRAQRLLPFLEELF